MPIIISSNSNYSDRINGIRRLVAIGISSADDLLDSDIADDAFLGLANRYIAKKVPKWADLSGDNRNDLEVAVQKFCAAQLLKSTARPIHLDAGTAQDRQVYLDIKETIGYYLQDVLSTINELLSLSALTSEAYFEVIDITSDIS